MKLHDGLNGLFISGTFLRNRTKNLFKNTNYKSVADIWRTTCFAWSGRRVCQKGFWMTGMLWRRSFTPDFDPGSPRILIVVLSGCWVGATHF